jgi:hypothetical protein
MDDIFTVQPVDKGPEPVGLDLPNGEKQSPHPRRGNGRKRISVHPSTLVCPLRIVGCW